MIVGTILHFKHTELASIFIWTEKQNFYLALYLLLKLTGKEAKNHHWQLYSTWQFHIKHCCKLTSHDLPINISELCTLKMFPFILATMTSEKNKLQHNHSWCVCLYHLASTWLQLAPLFFMASITNLCPSCHMYHVSFTSLYTHITILIVIQAKFNT